MVADERRFDTFEEAAGCCINRVFATLSDEMDWSGLKGRTIYRFNRKIIVDGTPVGKVRIDGDHAHFYSYFDRRDKLRVVSRDEFEPPVYDHSDREPEGHEMDEKLQEILVEDGGDDEN